MNPMEIYTNGSITLDGKSSGLGVTQRNSGTVVYYLLGDNVDMPSNRYALSTDKPASGVPGRADFERDIRSLLNWS